MEARSITARVYIIDEPQRLLAELAEFIEHYHQERNHQGLGNEPIHPVPAVWGTGWVRRRKRLGGLLNYYYRAT
jgi:hypothetical protein